MNKKSFLYKCFLSSGMVLTSISFNACMPNSAIPTMFIASNPNAGNPVDPVTGLPVTPISNPSNPTNPNSPSGELPGTPTPNSPNNGNTDHPAPPDPQQPQTEDDFWKLMGRFGFMQTRTKAQLLVDIKAGVAMKIADWSPGTEKDKTKNIAGNYKAAQKYLNPAASTQAEYLKRSMTLATRPAQSIDFYLDVEYGAKSGRGTINMQRIEPKTLEVLYYNKSGLITNYTQTKLPTAGPPALLRLTHFMFIPPAVYK